MLLSDVNERVPSASFVVGTHCVWVRIRKSFLICIALIRSACFAAKPLVWADGQEPSSASSTRPDHVAPVVCGSRSIAAGSRCVSAAALRAVFCRLVPGVEPLSAVLANAAVGVPINASFHARNFITQVVAYGR